MKERCVWISFIVGMGVVGTGLHEGYHYLNAKIDPTCDPIEVQLFSQKAWDQDSVGYVKMVGDCRYSQSEIIPWMISIGAMSLPVCLFAKKRIEAAK
jgi:hypothetical protein